MIPVLRMLLIKQISSISTIKHFASHVTTNILPLNRPLNTDYHVDNALDIQEYELLRYLISYNAPLQRQLNLYKCIFNREYIRKIGRIKLTEYT